MFAAFVTSAEKAAIDDIPVPPLGTVNAVPNDKGPLIRLIASENSVPLERINTVAPIGIMYPRPFGVVFPVKVEQ